MHLGPGNVLVHCCQYEYCRCGECNPRQGRLQAFGERQLGRDDEVQDVRINHRTGEEQHDHEGGEQQNREHHSQHLPETALPGNLPHVVEHAAHAHHHPNQDPQEGEHAYEAEQAGFRREEDMVGRVQEIVDENLIVDVGEEELRQAVRQAKAAGEVEGDGQEGHDGHHALVAEGRHLETDFLVGEGVHHQQHGADIRHRPFLEAGHIVGIQEPDVVRDEANHPVD